MRRWLGVAVVMVGLLAGDAFGAAREVRVPLREGKLRVGELSAALVEKMGLPERAVAWTRAWGAADMDVSGLGGTLFVRALNRSLGDGCRTSVCDDGLVISFDTDTWRWSARDVKGAVRTFTAAMQPDATGAQNRFYGLLMPKRVDPDRPMVVLVHGLDCNRGNWLAMAHLLVGQGYQVAYFTYPSDQPLSDSADLLVAHLAALRESFPAMRVDVIAHSMGSLVARAAVESERYEQRIDSGINHLILIAPPNHGTRWARYRLLLEVEEHWKLSRVQDDWSWTWAITDGLGEAGRDLKPGSRFLRELNDRPRRDGVKYTIIAGNRNEGWRWCAVAIHGAGNVLAPGPAKHWWGLRQTRNALSGAARKLSERTCASDGPVTARSTTLDGVQDWVELPGDHTSLHASVAGKQPVAWETVQARLAE
ncbi:MAG: esterase/lipase family protein [Tepidisphaeraceae bacterium]